MSLLRSASSKFYSHDSLCSASSAEAETTSYACWERLRTVALAIRTTRATLKHHQSQVQENGDLYHLIEGHQLTNEIRNHEIVISRYQKAVEQLKRISTKKRLNLAKINEELSEKKRISSLELVCCSFASTLATRRKYLSLYRQLIKTRRRTLLKEISDVFEIIIQTPVEELRKRECSCSACDTICGVHLPLTRDIVSHQEIEVAAAFGHIVHFLDCLSLLLDYIFRYPVLSGASTSCIHSPKDCKNLPLHGTRWRAGRVRLDQALALLGENLSQLRDDTGFRSLTRSDNLLLSVHDWMKGVLQSGVPIVYHHRPVCSLRSPAGLINLEPKVEDEEVLRSISWLEKQLDNAVV